MKLSIFIRFSICILLLNFSSVGLQCTNDCNYMDVIFLVDAASYLKPAPAFPAYTLQENFVLTKEFMIELSNTFETTLGKTTRVALLQYSTIKIQNRPTYDVEIQYSKRLDDQCRNLTCLRRAIIDLQWLNISSKLESVQHSAGFAVTHAADMYTYSANIAKTPQKLIIVITDGALSDTDTFIAEARSKISKETITLAAIGIGNHNLSHLFAVANSSSNFILTINDHSQLRSLIKNLTETAWSILAYNTTCCSVVAIDCCSANSTITIDTELVGLHGEQRMGYSDAITGVAILYASFLAILFVAVMVVVSSMNLAKHSRRAAKVGDEETEAEKTLKLDLAKFDSWASDHSGDDRMNTKTADKVTVHFSADEVNINDLKVAGKTTSCNVIPGRIANATTDVFEVANQARSCCTIPNRIELTNCEDLMIASKSSSCYLIPDEIEEVDREILEVACQTEMCCLIPNTIKQIYPEVSEVACQTENGSEIRDIIEQGITVAVKVAVESTSCCDIPYRIEKGTSEV